MADVNQRHLDQAKTAIRAAYNREDPRGTVLSLVPLAQAIADAEERAESEFMEAVSGLKILCAESRTRAEKAEAERDELAKTLARASAALAKVLGEKLPPPTLRPADTSTEEQDLAGDLVAARRMLLDFANREEGDDHAED